jgi:hypothetical protein
MEKGRKKNVERRNVEENEEKYRKGKYLNK